MRVRHIAPSRPLAPFVATFTVVEAEEESTRLLVPDSGITVGFRYGGSASDLASERDARIPDFSFAGLRSAARRMRTSAGGGVVLAKFREGGALPFLDLPLHELFGRTVALDEVVPRGDIERTMEQIHAATSDFERVAVVEQFLMARRVVREQDALVLLAVKAIRSQPAAVRIGELAQSLGISRDRLQKRFRQAVGSSPKQLASILRLHHAIRAYRSGLSLTDLSMRAGYADQSHFNREFRLAMGEAPQQFFKTGAYC